MKKSFPQHLYHEGFYSVYLPDLIKFAEDTTSADNELCIDLSNTEFISPDVICDLLSFFKLLQKKRIEVLPWLLFGHTSKVIEYLNNSQFFLLSEYRYLFDTDLDFTAINPDMYNQKKGKLTGKFKRLSFPTKKLTDPEISRIKTRIGASLSQLVFDLFIQEKQNQMSNFSINKPSELDDGFFEIVENAFDHSDDVVNPGCYYTFQSYESAGFTFACSDTGIGFYKSLYKKFFAKEILEKKQKILNEKKKRLEEERKKSNADQNMLDEELENLEMEQRKLEWKKKNLVVKFPKVFSKDEYISYENDDIKRSIAGIIESLVYNIDEGNVANYGYPYIFRNLILNNNGTMYIHCDNLQLKVDLPFLYDKFDISSITNIQKKTEFTINGFKKEKLRNLINNPKSNGAISVFPYTFPGVHISLHLRRN